jgi:hypothetical protein
MKAKKRWFAVVGAVVTLAVVLSASLPALAQSDAEAPVETRPQPKALGIKAPWVAQMGEEVSIGVYDRRNERPVNKAGVWALTREAAQALKAEVAELREADAEIDYEALVSLKGIFLGKTNEDGLVKHAFDEPGRYLLVAVKKGYFPGFRRIAIRPALTDSADDASSAGLSLRSSTQAGAKLRGSLRLSDGAD